MENKKEISNQELNSALHKTDVSGSSDFIVECNVCKLHYENWTGSTPCCGSIAYLVEDGKATTKISLFTSIFCKKL